MKNVKKKLHKNPYKSNVGMGDLIRAAKLNEALSKFLSNTKKSNTKKSNKKKSNKKKL